MSTYGFDEGKNKKEVETKEVTYPRNEYTGSALDTVKSSISTITSAFTEIHTVLTALKRSISTDLNTSEDPEFMSDFNTAMVTLEQRLAAYESDLSTNKDKIQSDLDQLDWYHKSGGGAEG